MKTKFIFFICTLAFGLYFLTMLYFKVSANQVVATKDNQVKTVVASDKQEWMEIYLRDKKIGYTHRKLTKVNQGYSVDEATCLRINALGVVQEIRIETKGKLNIDMSLSSFTFNVLSHLFKLQIDGQVQDNKQLVLTVNEQKISFPLKEPIYLPANISDIIASDDSKDSNSNARQVISIFDPSAMVNRPVVIEYVGYDNIKIKDKFHLAKKYKINYMGAEHLAWIGNDGKTIQEQGFMGLLLKKSTKQDALKDFSQNDSEDITEMVSVLPDKKVDNYLLRTKLVMKITGASTDQLFLDGGRQVFKNGVLTITKESLNTKESTGNQSLNKNEYARYLESTPFIQSDNLKIKKLVDSLVSEINPVIVNARKLLDWTYTNIEKRPVLSVPNALQTLENKMGDCNEHSFLIAAMARASGIPTDIEAGLVYLKGRFYYHAWNVIYINGSWVTLDAVMNQMPVDVTHIRLIRGGLEKQVDLIGIIGNIKIEIIE